MKNSLVKHIKQIFEVLEIHTEYSVYDSVNDVLPSWLQSVELTHEFVISCDAVFEKERLQGFIHKDLLEVENHYYWFEGEEKSRKTLDNIVNDKSPIQLKEKLKINTRLPSWLDNFIFNTLNAEYAPDFQRFEYNLNLTREDNQRYLGTYFPRSYAETFCIFDNLFHNETVKSYYTQLNEISILSVGCGSGGDLLGLLTAINKHFQPINKMNVVAIDGNSDALSLSSQIIGQASQQFHKEIVFIKKQLVFEKDTVADMQSSFDFIITSKMINEIINKGNGRMDNSYYDFATTYSPMLKDYGLMMLLDVTTKVGISEFCPILLNKQINQFIHKHPDFVSIIPIPCVGNENCQVQCFSQKEFSVSHSKCANDKSRVTYRILVKRTLSQKLKLRQDDVQYQIHPDRCCGQGSVIADGFYLPKAIPNEKTDSFCKMQNDGSERKLEDIKHTSNEVGDNADKQELSEDRPVCQPSGQLREAYVIDTNAFIYVPNIIDKIADEYPIFISAKVVDELDHRKDVTSGNDKKKVQKALRSINMAISKGRVQTITSDARLLPTDFDRCSSDNLILSVALKLKKSGYSPILVTSDNGFQVKAKTLKIKTITYTKVKSKI